MDQFFKCGSLQVGNIIETIYRKNYYELTSLTSSIFPNSTFVAQNGSEISFSDYYQGTYNIEIKDKTTQLYKAIPSGKIKLKSYLGIYLSLLNSPFLSKISSNITFQLKNYLDFFGEQREGHIRPEEVHLVPEFCRFQFPNMTIVSILKKIPSVFYKLDWYCKYCYLDSALPFWAKNVSIGDIESVFTTLKSNSDKNHLKYYFFLKNDRIKN